MPATHISGRVPSSIAPVEARVERTERTRWHYTTGENLSLILRDRFIKPATAFVPLGERPIVWFSTNPNWEPTASKATIDQDNVFSRLTMAETAELCGGLARFAVAPETAPHDWRALKGRSGMSNRMVQHLYKEGINQGARPGDWWGTFDPVPRSKWIAVQGYELGRWVDAPFDV
jgi:hypothetical protein